MRHRLAFQLGPYRDSYDRIGHVLLMPASAVDFGFEVLGKLAAALIGLAGAVYAVQRRLKRDRFDDAEVSLLGRGKQTIFEQYEGVIKRLEGESKRQHDRIERLLDDQTTMREMLSRAQGRILEIERDRDVLRKIVREMAGDILSLKRQKITLDDLQDTGVYETRFHS